MAAKIFKAPPGAPEFGRNMNFAEYNAACTKWLDTVKAGIKKESRSNDPAIGEEIRFPYADGYARYIVANLKPVELIHIPLGDGWQFPQAHLMTAAEIKKMIARDKQFAKIFSKRR